MKYLLRDCAWNEILKGKIRVDIKVWYKYEGDAVYITQEKLLLLMMPYYRKSLHFAEILHVSFLRAEITDWGF